MAGPIGAALGEAAVAETASANLAFGVTGGAALGAAVGDIQEIVNLVKRMAANPLVAATMAGVFQKKIRDIVSNLKGGEKTAGGLISKLHELDWTKLAIIGGAAIMSFANRLVQLKDAAEITRRDLERDLGFEPDLKLYDVFMGEFEAYRKGGKDLQEAYNSTLNTMASYTRTFTSEQRKEIAKEMAQLTVAVGEGAVQDIINLSVNMNIGLMDSVRMYKEMAIEADRAHVPLGEYSQIVTSLTQGLYLYGVTSETAREATHLLTGALREGKLSWTDATQSLASLMDIMTKPEEQQQRLQFAAMITAAWDDLGQSTRDLLNQVSREKFGRAFMDVGDIGKQAFMLMDLGATGLASTLVDLTDALKTTMGLGEEWGHLAYEAAGLNITQIESWRTSTEHLGEAYRHLTTADFKDFQENLERNVELGKKFWDWYKIASRALGPVPPGAWSELWRAGITRQEEAKRTLRDIFEGRRPEARAGEGMAALRVLGVTPESVGEDMALRMATGIVSKALFRITLDGTPFKSVIGSWISEYERSEY